MKGTDSSLSFLKHAFKYVCRRGENTLLVMVYNSKIEMINDLILDCATRCLESLKIILTKEKQMKQSSNKNDLFILLADINFQQEKILSIAKRELECRICKKAFRCEHKVAKLIPEFHIKL